MNKTWKGVSEPNLGLLSLKTERGLATVGRCFQDHLLLPEDPRAWMFLSPNKTFPTRSGLLGPKGPRIILPSSLAPYPITCLFTEYYSLNGFYLIPERLETLIHTGVED